MEFKPIKMMDIEISRPLAPVSGLAGYAALKALVRLHGTPLGYIQLPLADGCCAPATLRQAILEQFSWPILSNLVAENLARPQPELSLAKLLASEPPPDTAATPLVTVVVCTRDRPDDLAQCLEALCQLDYPALDLLVVDNAPSSEATAQLVRERFPSVRYAREPRPGLDWARNCAIREARGELLAYTDDDVVVDPGWVRALVAAFADDPSVMAVTGLVVPFELETPAQLLFEIYGGFGRGFERRRHQLDSQLPKHDLRHIGTGTFGTGANMAYRRSVFGQIGDFDPALDVGTVTNGGGDIEMFFRVLKGGHALLYEPRALVRHRHRREYARLRTQIANNGVGFTAYLQRIALFYPDERRTCLRLARWQMKRHVKQLVKSLIGKYRFPPELILAEMRGMLIGLGRYTAAQRGAAQLKQISGPPEPAETYGEWASP